MIDWLSTGGEIASPITVGTVVLLILRGKLITRKQADELINVYKDSANTWHQAYDKEAERGTNQEKALQETLELSRVSVKVLQDMNALHDEGGKSATTIS